MRKLGRSFFVSVPRGSPLEAGRSLALTGVKNMAGESKQASPEHAPRWERGGVGAARSAALVAPLQGPNSLAGMEPPTFARRGVWGAV